MFNKELHRRLEGDEEREVTVVLLQSQYDALKRVMDEHGWDESEGLSFIFGAGIRVIEGWTEADKPLDQMTVDERLRFLQDRASHAEAGYSMLKFQAYQVMNQNDALEMNMRGLMPQLKGTRERLAELEAEIHELRHRAPPPASAQPPASDHLPSVHPSKPSLGNKFRRLFRRK